MRHCPGCNQRIPPGKCATCGKRYEAMRRKDPVRRMNQDRYGSAQWKRFRAEILAARPSCECGCGRAADTVAHIIPVVQAPGLQYAWDNVRALAKRCHSSESVVRGERWPRR
jgi:5-methylcytosine-specific restriction endonuclease McrA